MMRHISIGAFTGFKVVLYFLEVSHLKYADGYVLVCVPSMDNVLTVKVILSSFVLAEFNSGFFTNLLSLFYEDACFSQE